LPGFQPRGPARQTTKSLLLRGELDGTPVLVKKLLRPDSVWGWYFGRELAIYRAFSEEPPPVRVPRLVRADAASGLLVLELLAGRPLAQHRRTDAALGSGTQQELLRICRELGAWRRGLERMPSEAPRPEQRRVMRDRLLEDPGSPLGWVREGLVRCAGLGLLEDSAATALVGLLEGSAVTFAHGDLMPRNLIQTEDGRLALVDWECAGPHPAGWDRALLWVNMPAARVALEAEAPPAFWVCVAFALCRELKFRRRVSDGRPDDPVAQRLGRELLAVLARTELYSS
jgi:hypothetical protein